MYVSYTKNYTFRMQIFTNVARFSHISALSYLPLQFPLWLLTAASFISTLSDWAGANVVWGAFVVVVVDLVVCLWVGLGVGGCVICLGLWVGLWVGRCVGLGLWIGFDFWVVVGLGGFVGCAF